MKHLDLFSGIGGFAYAADQVWDDVEHIFCDSDKFCRQVLRKNWPNSKIYEDIRLITNTIWIQQHWREWKGQQETLITGGFPCQPFSQAGKRKGTDDDRYLWPEMLRVIQLANPQWVIAENVRGLLTQSGGMVFEQVCLDLEASGYEVQPFIIPAVAKNAPHRRDRVWFVAHRTGERPDTGKCDGEERHLLRNEDRDAEKSEPERDGWKRGASEADKSSQNSLCQRGSGRGENGRQILERQSTEAEAPRPSGESRNDNNAKRKGLEREKHKKPTTTTQPDWGKNWLEVATELCGVDDGLPEGLDFAGWSKARHRVERLKSLGNAIVPQVAIEIMLSISKP